jgi:ParB family chromosome partitioning protein
MSDYRVEQIPRKLISWPEQERKHFGAEALTELAATIRMHGFLEPIGVFREGDRYKGIWGQRRWMAAEIASLDLVPAVVHPKPLSEVEASEIRLIENVAREGLRPMELAAGLAQLIKLGGLSATEVAKRVGMNPATVTKSLALLDLPLELQKKIDAGVINAASGYQLARINNSQIQAELAGQVASGALSRDQLIGKVKAMKRGNGTAAKSKSRVTAMIDPGRSITFSGAGLASVETLIDWLEELLAKARKVRPQNLALGTFISMLRDQAKP